VASIGGGYLLTPDIQPAGKISKVR